MSLGKYLNPLRSSLGIRKCNSGSGLGKKNWKKNYERRRPILIGLINENKSIY